MSTDSQYQIYTIRTKHNEYINYCYVVINRKTLSAFIVDPSWDITPFLNTLETSGGVLKMILLTHSHYDHVNLVDDLVNKYDLPVYISDAECNYYDYNCRNLSRIQDFESLYLDDLRIDCILTPGHTVGSMCFHIKGSLFTGDTIFAEGCGICSLRGGAATAMFDSLKKIRLLIPSTTKIYPGHCFGLPVGQIFEKLLSENIYFLIKNREQFTNFRMRKNQSLFEDFK